MYESIYSSEWECLGMYMIQADRLARHFVYRPNILANLLLVKFKMFMFQWRNRPNWDVYWPLHLHTEVKRRWKCWCISNCTATEDTENSNGPDYRKLPLIFLITSLFWTTCLCENTDSSEAFKHWRTDLLVCCISFRVFMKSRFLASWFSSVKTSVNTSMIYARNRSLSIPWFAKDVLL